MKFVMAYSCGKDSTLALHHMLAQMEACGADLCGENGEYHTLVTDGPIFRRPLAFQTGGILRFGAFSVIEVTAEQSASAT